ncbi:hypothetical protein HORIV_36020 [Vreelandella olivaria]|uniref:Cytochrome b561 bacterial/Ni-hydrogenase domain-containing protein n=1 Tax=Vreelandella olivaria TaxID=390919 RepID=A0ABM7GKA8_9GAMM|nr:hypothetical protein HORIV_36020 [Halomonas olivaria]
MDSPVPLGISGGGIDLFYTTKTSGAPFLFPVEVHAQAGYVVIGLLVFRWLWGALGSVYARFRTFLYPSAKTVAYSKSLLKRQPSAYASHNPLGGWMVMLMLLSLSFQAVSGLFLSDDIFFKHRSMAYLATGWAAGLEPCISSIVI